MRNMAHTLRECVNNHEITLSQKSMGSLGLGVSFKISLGVFLTAIGLGTGIHLGKSPGMSHTGGLTKWFSLALKICDYITSLYPPVFCPTWC